MQNPLDLVCFSHLRWHFVFQRPNHLMVRCARERRVFFVEEPVFDAERPRVDIDRVDERLLIVVPHLPREAPAGAVPAMLESLVTDLFKRFEIERPIAWYYTPMALEFTRSLSPSLVIYDCMDQLSLFHGAPPKLVELERELLDRANLVFTGGVSLYEDKRHHHDNVHAFPSSVDAAHFRSARERLADPPDQEGISRPRLGFYGVIDERLDLGLVQHVATERPDWQIVLVGPIVKIDPASVPELQNLHLLGQKAYAELPRYLSGWDVAIMPFAENDATRFISPTKTLEFLAGGRPVVSTPIQDVVRPYGEQGLIEIARKEEFVRAVERALAAGFEPIRERTESLLAGTSWDETWGRMSKLIKGQLM